MSLQSTLLLGFGITFLISVNCNLESITSTNHDEIIQNSRLTFVAFTASWCPFSRKLMSSFSQAAADYQAKYPDRKTVWGNVDCMAEDYLMNKYSITKFPTMKVFFYGYMMTEYRGSRQVKGLIEYIEKMENTSSLVNLNEAESLTQWQNYVIPQKGTLILWFPRGSPPFELILKAIALIHSQLVVVVPISENLLKHEDHQLWFSLDGEHVERFEGSVSNFKEIVEWIKKKSAGMVRELTFENMEEMVEDGKPLLILLRKKDDIETEKQFVTTIRRELDQDTLLKLAPVMADGKVLTAVLRHFNKGLDDLPFLLIDQFTHSFPSPWKGNEIFAEGNIKQFVADLFNDNHHRKLHEKLNELIQKIVTETEEIEKQASEEKVEKPTEKLEKHESVFNKLKPASTRYSFAKEEL
ncbi:Thioredoxin domain-containing protein [Caenorhabditis elegans]|uniref:Thioredoxin domain-containing protein n=1 Tax=Caenorhabditis elegans TaxID=6239 RepID=A0A4V0ILH1_CAEEL|nr:Thioredoxin domain-containing protein [Caenorhabditis elegans]VTW47192.1 Thioredoxin domain-containing protein [Caenorhabditis elegans]